MHEPLVTFLRSFRDITATDAALISDAFIPRSISEGTELFKGGGRVCREMFFICTGVLRIRIAHDKGSEVTLYFLKENQFCTILNSFKNDVPVAESIQAACNATVLAISCTKLLALYEKLPYLNELIDQITQQGLMNKIALRNTYHGQDAPTRYQLFLKQQPEIAMRVALSDIASYLGVTPQSLSRIRRNIR